MRVVEFCSLLGLRSSLMLECYAPYVHVHIYIKFNELYIIIHNVYEVNTHLCAIIIANYYIKYNHVQLHVQYYYRSEKIQPSNWDMHGNLAEQ